VRQIVIDTNVFVSALRSRRGASFLLLTMIDKGQFEVNISVPLIVEFEDAAKRTAKELVLTNNDIDDILDYMCKVANKRKIHFLWRPVLKDPRDDHVLELAVESGSKHIITYNIRDFSEAKHFGITVLTPRDFLQIIGGLP
jgi:putative PIN family toxin of toxin-antitoxin system